MEYEKIGRFITKLREEKGFTQVQLASYLNVNENVIYKLEKGDIGCDLVILDDISNFFGVSIEELLLGKRKSCKILVNAKMMVIFLLILVSVLIVFLLYKNEKCKIYYLGSYNDKYTISGFAFLNRDFNYIVIDSVINNNDVDLEVYSFQYSFYSNGMLLYKQGMFHHMFIRRIISCTL